VPSTLLEAPQGETGSEEQVIMRSLAPLKTNTRAGSMPRNPARKSCRAVRIEKITALTVLDQFSTRELHMLHTSGHFLSPDYS